MGLRHGEVKVILLLQHRGGLRPPGEDKDPSGGPSRGGKEKVEPKREAAAKPPSQETWVACPQGRDSSECLIVPSVLGGSVISLSVRLKCFLSRPPPSPVGLTERFVRMEPCPLPKGIIHLRAQGEVRRETQLQSPVGILSCYQGTLGTWSQPGPSPSRGGQLSAMATSQAQLVCFRMLTTNTQAPQPPNSWASVSLLPWLLGLRGEQEGAEVIEMLF